MKQRLPLRFFFSILAIALVVSFGCGPSEPEVEEQEPMEAEPAPKEEPPTEAEPTEEEPPAEETEKEESDPGQAGRAPTTPEATDVSYYEDTVWAEGKEGVLMKGLDGGLYEPYLPVVIEQVQETLKEKGYYDGAITGVLDQETMNALGQFQKENQLQVSGVPSPRTREVLLAQEEVPAVT